MLVIIIIINMTDSNAKQYFKNQHGSASNNYVIDEIVIPDYQHGSTVDINVFVHGANTVDRKLWESDIRLVQNKQDERLYPNDANCNNHNKMGEAEQCDTKKYHSVHKQSGKDTPSTFSSYLWKKMSTTVKTLTQFENTPIDEDDNASDAALELSKIVDKRLSVDTTSSVNTESTVEETNLAVMHEEIIQKTVASEREKQQRFSIKMVLSIGLPVLALFGLCLFPIVYAAIYYNAATRSIEQFEETLVLARLLNLLQGENSLSGLYLASSNNDEAKSFLVNRILEVDNALMDSYEATGLALDGYNEEDGVLQSLSQHREQVLIGSATLERSLAVYKKVNIGVLKQIEEHLVLEIIDVDWELYTALMAMLQASDALSIQGAIGAYYLAMCQVSDNDQKYISELAGVINAQLEASAIYADLSASSFRLENADVISELSQAVEKVVSDECQSSNPAIRLQQAKAFIVSVNEYRVAVIEWQNSVVSDIKLKKETIAMALKVNLTVVVVSLLSVMLLALLSTILFIHTLKAMMNRLKHFSNLIENEKKKHEDFLSLMLPQSVAKALTQKRRVKPRNFKMVTIAFTNIVGFMSLSDGLKPMQIVDMLNGLFLEFDEAMEKYDVFKVTTVGDSCMIVSGAPKKNGTEHASQIAGLSLELIDVTYGFSPPHDDNLAIEIRIGIHSGPVTGGLVGISFPRYCLFGNTLNIAQTIESAGKSMKIHVSRASKKILQANGGFVIKKRGKVDALGIDGPEMTTYWLEDYAF